MRNVESGSGSGKRFAGIPIPRTCLPDPDPLAMYLDVKNTAFSAFSAYSFDNQ